MKQKTTPGRASGSWRSTAKARAPLIHTGEWITGEDGKRYPVLKGQIAGKATFSRERKRRPRGYSRLSREVLEILKREGRDSSAKMVLRALEKTKVARVGRVKLRWKDDAGRVKVTLIKSFEDHLTDIRKRVP